MLVRLTEIPVDGKKRYEGEEDASVLDVRKEKDCVEALHPICYDIQASVVPGRLVAQGKVWTEVRFRCVRCAEFFALALREEHFECVKELEKDELSVDLTEDIRETILLHFPGHPVCKADCRGLCLQCGTNLNERKCRCRPRGDGRWGTLDKLNLPSGPERS